MTMGSRGATFLVLAALIVTNCCILQTRAYLHRCELTETERMTPRLPPGGDHGLLYAISSRSEPSRWRPIPSTVELFSRQIPHSRNPTASKIQNDGYTNRTKRHCTKMHILWTCIHKTCQLDRGPNPAETTVKTSSR